MKDLSGNNSPGSQFLRTDGGKTKSNAIEIPSVSLPKGGGAIKGIDEKFSVNAVNGTASFSIPLPFSPARGASPSLSLAYNSGAGNNIFGLGWNLDLSSIKRKTDTGLPQYQDAEASDTFLFSEADDLVPEFNREPNGSFSIDSAGDYLIKEKDSPDGSFIIRFYRPRIEGLFSRIERWTEKTTGIIKWRIITKENLTTLFGWTPNAVIADPNDHAKIFEWRPEFVFDDKGNCSHYIYRKEDHAGFAASLIHNRNRKANGNITYVNIYPEKVLYGNKTPYNGMGDSFPAEKDYLFSTVFDYGEYDQADPETRIKDWDFRKDAFSDYRAGFEIRTTRLCKRVLLFHHFTGANEYEGLVKSVNFEYDTSSQQNFTFLKSITMYGYIKLANGTYTHKSLPAIEFQYQKPDWNTDIKAISTDSMIHAPAGLDEQLYQFTDLFNEGLPGILTEQANGWYYKHNLGDGNFNQTKLITPKPSFVGLGRQLQLTDLDGDGGKQLVSLDTEPIGFFELDDASEWQGFRNFQNMPNINFGDAYTRMLDLNGDGKPEVLISEDSVFTWYPSAGREGFSQAQQTTKPFDEEAGPSVVFADATQSIFLADMSGDGLTDIVRIRNGEVCYWPNLGYGKFGAKVAMDNAPWFDHPGKFNPSFLLLADVDGSGTTDVMYLGKNKFTCWMNLSGNSFCSKPFEIKAFPDIHDQSKITVTDLLGNGTACLVWSCGLSKDAGTQLRYVDLMNSRKPHIMVSYKNNLGKEAAFEYTPSTKFYLEDKLAGNPWITKLHFPVHCVSKVETRDEISGTRFITLYKYHHGYYDHAEREFRGFGMTEQTDSEHFEHWIQGNSANIVEKEIHQEPVVTKTWSHTGAFLNREKILHQFADEYWYEEMCRQGIAVTHHEFPLPDARIMAAPGLDQSVIDQLSTQEWREALRACKGVTLRSEVFADDAILLGATPQEVKKHLTPYTVSVHNCVIELLQPKGKNSNAIFVVKESEAINYSYERNFDDPRIAHQLNIKLDEYGNVVESARVVYPRMVANTSVPAETREAQQKTVILFTQNCFTNDISGDDIYRLRLPAETKTYELKGVTKANLYFTPGDFEDILSDANSTTAFYHEIEKPLIPGKAQKRLIEHLRSTYYRNNLTEALPLHQLESLALPYENYQMAYTPELLNDIFGAKANTLVMVEGKFIHGKDEYNLEDGNWWVPSGKTLFIENGETVIDARNRFYAPVAYIDPCETGTKVRYYGSYFLFIEETEDVFGNTTRVDKFNFRTLAAQRMKDINGNLSETISDELGLVKATAVSGKGDEADDLAGINEYSDDEERELVRDFFTLPCRADGLTDSDALSNMAKQLLQHATSRFVYDFDGYKISGKPAVIVSILREAHYCVDNQSPVQLGYEYSNGVGQVVMKKVQAESGMAKNVTINADNTYSITDTDTSSAGCRQLRWLGNGKTILNNKGNAVKQYEPWFSVTHHYEDLKELVETGVTPIMFYDAPGRLVKTELPDGTFSKVEFDSWKQTIFDASDTILDSSWYTNRTKRLIDDLLKAEGKDPGLEQKAAEKAGKHASTPMVMHFDSMGRPVLSIVQNRNIATNEDEYDHTKTIIDAEGNLLRVTDARETVENGMRGNTVIQYKYDMLGNLVYQCSMDAGQRWKLINILGNPLRTWDERDHEFQYSYDALHRPAFSKVIGGDGTVALDHIFDRIIYGDSLLESGRSNETTLQKQNILGKAFQHYDTGGAVFTPEYDFKGQPTSVTRRLFKDYKSVVNWINAAPGTDLENDEFTFTTETDALGRITRQTAPDRSIIIPSYNKTGLLNFETVTHVNPDHSSTSTGYIQEIAYNERGQRTNIIYGNDVSTRFYYDRETFRLIRLITERKNSDVLQDWHYTYDPVGNITHIEDRNIPVTFFANQKIAGISEYTYDALYRLTEATGRENNAALNFGECDNWNDAPYLHHLNPGEPMSVRNYTEKYQYDPVGNLMQMKHIAAGGSWTRNYEYETTRNRLKSTSIGDNGNPANYTNYRHHEKHGFLEELPHLEKIGWNFKEEVVRTSRQRCTGDNTPETTYYQYDGEGQRIRKITENAALSGSVATKKEERIYLEGYETYRTYRAGTISFERESLSLMDEGHRFVMVETVIKNSDPFPDPSGSIGTRLTRYQLHNHLGSAALELDGSAQVISYEEYHPFGTTTYQAKNATVKAAAKRYRYTGMERDEETGMEYHSARYYLPWLGRWLNPDPTGIEGGMNFYAYVNGNPIRFYDASGTDACGMIDEESGMSCEMPCIAYSDPQDEAPPAPVPQSVRVRRQHQPTPIPPTPPQQSPTGQSHPAPVQPASEETGNNTNYSFLTIPVFSIESLRLLNATDIYLVQTFVHDEAQRAERSQIETEETRRAGPVVHAPFPRSQQPMNPNSALQLPIPPEYTGLIEDRRVTGAQVLSLKFNNLGVGIGFIGQDPMSSSYFEHVQASGYAMDLVNSLGEAYITRLSPRVGQLQMIHDRSTRSNAAAEVFNITTGAPPPFSSLTRHNMNRTGLGDSSSGIFNFHRTPR